MTEQEMLESVFDFQSHYAVKIIEFRKYLQRLPPKQREATISALTLIQLNRIGNAVWSVNDNF